MWDGGLTEAESTRLRYTLKLSVRILGMESHTYPINDIVYKLFPSTSASKIVVDTDVPQDVLQTPTRPHQQPAQTTCIRTITDDSQPSR